MLPFEYVGCIGYAIACCGCVKATKYRLLTTRTSGVWVYAASFIMSISSFICKPFFLITSQRFVCIGFCCLVCLSAYGSIIHIESMVTAICYFIDKCVNFVDTKMKRMKKKPILYVLNRISRMKLNIYN